jgi:hypothetical protein
MHMTNTRRTTYEAAETGGNGAGAGGSGANQWRSSKKYLGGAHRIHNFLMTMQGRTSIANIWQI